MILFRANSVHKEKNNMVVFSNVERKTIIITTTISFLFLSSFIYHLSTSHFFAFFTSTVLVFAAFDFNIFIFSHFHLPIFFPSHILNSQASSSLSLSHPANRKLEYKRKLRPEDLIKIKNTMTNKK